MWTISGIKKHAKMAFKRNYWKCVLVSMIIIVMSGGISFSGNLPSGMMDSIKGLGAGVGTSTPSVESSVITVPENDLTLDLEGIEGFDTDDSYDTDDSDDTYDANDLDDIYNNADITDNSDDSIDIFSGENAGILAATIISGVVILFVIIAIAFAFAFVVDAFIYNPIELGVQRFNYRNIQEPAKVFEVAYAFDTNYMNIVKTLFMRDVFIGLWSLLLIVPGIIKAYEYRMVPYLLIENPNIDRKEAFRISKEMMKGEKWHTFGLDLSFIPWILLSLVTCGIVGIFYYMPYRRMAEATLYDALKRKNVRGVNTWDTQF